MRRRSFLLLPALSLLLTLGLVTTYHPATANAASGPCATPSTDYGTVTSSVTIPVGTATATYSVWSRMAAVDSTNDHYLLEVDGASTSCYQVGGSNAKSVPIYTSTDDANGTRFKNDSSNWLNTDTGGAAISVSLPAGTTSIKMIGDAPGLVLDRLVFTQDTSCTPSGFGDNCVSAGDTTPPVGNITSPAANAIVSNPNVVVSASDDVGVTGVDIYDGATKLGSATLTSGGSTSGVWTYAWNTGSLAVGSSHTLTAHVKDGTNPEQSTGSVVVTIKDGSPPTGVAVTSPLDNATVSGTIAMAASASDNVGVTKVAFSVDSGTPVNVTTSGTPAVATTSLDTTTLSNGAHTLKVTAYDAASNSTQVTTSFTVNNQSLPVDTVAPVVTIPNLTANAVIASSASDPYVITAAVTDASGIKQVVFTIDGVAKPADTTSPYSFSLDTSTLTTGSHTISVKATDNSANLNVSLPLSVAFRVSLVSDVNRDCKVNFSDISAVVPKLGTLGSGLGTADVNGDDKVNFSDISAVVPKLGQAPC